MASSNIAYLGTDDYTKIYSDKHITNNFIQDKDKNFIACLGTIRKYPLDLLNFCIENNIDDNYIPNW